VGDDAHGLHARHQRSRRAGARLHHAGLPAGGALPSPAPGAERAATKAIDQDFC
jgi:hypothetical protein